MLPGMLSHIVQHILVGRDSRHPLALYAEGSCDIGIPGRIERVPCFIEPQQESSGKYIPGASRVHLVGRAGRNQDNLYV